MILEKQRKYRPHCSRRSLMMRLRSCSTSGGTLTFAASSSFVKVIPASSEAASLLKKLSNTSPILINPQ